MSGSIRYRLIAFHLLAVLSAALLLPVALYWRVDIAATQIHQGELRRRAEEVARYLRIEDGTFRLDLPPELAELYGQYYGGYLLAVLDEHGRVVFASRPKWAPLVHVDLNEGPSYFTRQLATGLMFGTSLPVSLYGRRAIIQVAEDKSHSDALRDAVMDGFLPRVLWVVLPILLVLLAADLLIFDRALRPLVRASALAERIGPEQTRLRLPEAPMPSEVRPLVHAVNAALDRLARAIALQHEFVADAAHELRTPLAILRAQAETLSEPALAAELVADIDAMSRIVSQMLDMADSDSLTAGPDDIADLASVCAEVAAFMAPLALAEGKEVALVGAVQQPVRVAGNPAALFRAVRNLVENAIRHTPKGTTVEIEVYGGGMIAVRDSGPGVPEEKREIVFQRFWRGDRRQRGTSGLGLAIVARIARTYGGTVRVGTAPGGGAEFILYLRPV